MIIQPDKIRSIATSWYKDILSSSVYGIPQFPRNVRFRKVKSNETQENFFKINTETDKLINGSKEKKGYGYTVELAQRNDRRIGPQKFPEKIYFETLDDYLKFFRKEAQYAEFIEITQRLKRELPHLLPWVESNPMKVIDNLGKWDDIIKVCYFFLENPMPNIFIREIPLDISTKFIEENKVIIKYLLDILIEDYVNKDETDFNKHFNLKNNEPLIRLKILDPKIAHEFFSGVDDLSIPQSQFNQLNLPCKRAFILENKTNYTNIFNFLTLPSLEGSIAIFGKGFGVGLLKDATWLSNKQIIYWGDIDPHGLQILSQIRGYFPQTQSCMMDLNTFTDFSSLSVMGACTDVTEIEHLTPDEHELFDYLNSMEECNRLEQEKIPHEYALKMIYEIVNI
ncbi:hypothetical protein SAMN04488589_1739 [Methanolobus vulcani]|uniref:Wadjet protein JetD C-terminal domain-containing protein n=1 Tax=Methanolobus vulcani TaxID=38026 RepID=A0A7Z7FCU6_9EURY|nr:Wadjet anti-phage system protein JetD domain-containing protein [Methanolobus vulcani]SDF93591.1 hypothetical protein SAMN04488589_1739 [Methanolobus vulcani]